MPFNVILLNIFNHIKILNPFVLELNTILVNLHTTLLHVCSCWHERLNNHKTKRNFYKNGKYLSENS